jgi:nitroreductase
MDVWEAIRSKRAIRHFTDQPLPQEVAERILDAGRRSQSSKNSQPWHFIAIRDRATLQQLSTMGDWLGHVAGAALCVVILTPAEDDGRAAWHMFDAGQSAAYMQLAAQELGVGSCLGSIYQPQAVRDLLGFPPEWQARLLISFGYPDPGHERRGLGREGRRPLDEVVHWDRW